MTRVLNVLGGLNRGGAETWMIQVLRCMKEASDVRLDFLVHTDGPFHYQAEAEALGSRVIVCKGVHCPPLYAWNLLRILRNYGPYRVIHSHNHYFSGIVLLVAAAAGVPVRVAQSHSDTRHVDAQAGPYRRIYTRLMKRLIWSCATVGTAVSKRAADALFPPDWRKHPKWQVMLPGIDPGPFTTPVDAEALRGELHIPAGVTVIGHVGRFDSLKNQKFFLGVAAEYLKSAPETVFLLVGEGPLRKDIERQAGELGIAENTRFAGVRKDVPALMRGVMDAFVFPSVLEGLPLVLLEAQAAGLPCLISETIAEESDIVPALMHRESLQASPACWAARARRLVELKTSGSALGCPEMVSVGRSMEGLLKCYSVRNANNECQAVF
jgi:glycosyltransferase involved in cell wall biosynthesis